MAGLGPSTVLQTSFTNFCHDFQAASTVGNYNNLAPYLYVHVVMHKVNDPSSVAGNPAAIIGYLNGTQIGQWPIFTLTGAAPHPFQSGNVGTVTGNATYADTNKSPALPVVYSFSYSRLSNTSPWLITLASATLV